jgi:ABC-type antimicrobial peptide transport system permease subunit
LNRETLVRLLREQMQAIDPDLPLFDIRTVDQQIAFNRWPQRVFGSLFAVFAVIALILGTIGLYGVTAYAASQRTREIGVRIALGATSFHIHRTVARTALEQLTMGLVLGAAGGMAVSRILPSQLAGTSANGPETLAFVALVLVGAGVIACWIPAQRALKIDPAVTLRDG